MATDPFTALGFTPTATPNTAAPQPGTPAAPSTSADPFASLGFTPAPTPQVKAPGFVDRVKADFDSRRKMLDEINTATIEGKQTVPEALLQHAGQVVGGAFDIATEAAKSVTPNFIKKPIKAGFGVLGKAVNSIAEPIAKKIAPSEDSINQASKLQGEAAILYHLAGSETDPVKKAKLRADAKSKVDIANSIADDINQVNDSLGRKARNVDAAINIGSILPVGEGGKLAAPLAGKTLEKVGTVIEKSGLDSANAARQTFAQELVKPIETKATKIADVSRTTEKGMGIFKSSTVAPTPEEVRMAEEVSKVPGINPNATLQQNYNALKSENIINAGQLVSDVKLNDFVIPRKESIARVNSVKNALADSPVIVGDAEKTADKLLNGAVKFINENDSTGSGLLQARKDYDQWVLSQKPAAFDAKAENAFTVANREIRKEMTKIVRDYAPNAKVQESLDRQTAIYSAMENVAPKAAEEANTAVGRSLQRIGEVLGTKNKIVQGIAAGVGIGGLGAAATFAPIVAGVGVPAYILYRAGRLIMNPQVRIGIGQILEKYGKVLNPEDVKVLNDAYKSFNLPADQNPVNFPGKQGGFVAIPGAENTDSFLAQEARKYKSAEDFVKAQSPVYHGSPVELKQFHNKNGAFFADNFPDASGFGGNPDHVYEGYLNFKKPLVIDAEGAKWNELNTKYGKSTKEVISNAQKDGYDGIVFKNIVDNIGDTAGVGGESTVSYAYKPKDSFLNESQLTEIWKKANKKSTGIPNKQGGFISFPAIGQTPKVPIPLANLPQATAKVSSYNGTIPRQDNNGNDKQRVNESLDKYAPQTKLSIEKGLKEGTVRFEPSPTGGEYIYSADKSFGKKNLKQKIDSIVNNVSVGAFKLASEIIKTPVRVGMGLVDVPRTFAGKEPLKPVDLGVLGKAESYQRSASDAVANSTDNLDAFAKVLGIASSSILDVAALGKAAQVASKAIGGNGGKAVKAVSDIFEPGGNTSNTMATYDKYISTGDYAPQDVYSDIAHKVFKPEIAKQIINDARLAVTQKGFPQLGEQIASQLDPTKLTPQTMIETAKSIINDLLKSHSFQAGQVPVGAVLGGAALTGAGVGATTPRKVTYTSNGQKRTLPAPKETSKPVSTKDIEPNLIANALTALESSGGTNKASADPGEKKWLTGLTDIAIKELKRLGRLPVSFNKNSEKDVKDASVKYFQLMQERNPGKSPGEIYVDHYWTQSTSTEQRRKKIEEFNKLINQNGD